MSTPKTPAELLDEKAKQLDAELKVLQLEEKVADAKRLVNSKRSWYHSSVQKLMSAMSYGKSAAVHPVATTVAAGGAGYAGVEYGAKPALKASEAILNTPALTTIVPSAIVGKGAYDLSRYMGAGKPLSYAAAAAAGGATAASESFVAVPLATGIASYWAANKAIQWSGLSRSAYPSMDGPGYWNFTKRNITSTPGKLAMGMFWSGWQPKLYNDLRWQERIGAAAPQAMRGLVRSFYTPWNSPKPDRPELGLQGFEKLPGLFIRPVVSAVHTLWNKVPGTTMFNSPDEFGKGVANIAWSPVKAASWLVKAPGRFWKYAWADPDAKK